MKKVFSIIIIILIIICIGLFFVGKYSDKIKEFFSKEDEEEILNNYGEITEEEALSYIDDQFGISYILNKKVENVEDIQALLDNYSNSDKLYLLMLKIESEGETVNRANVEKYAETIFGSADEIEHADILCSICNTNHYTFDTETNEYKKNSETPGHELIMTYVYNHVVDFEKVNNAYLLTVSKMFILIDPEFAVNAYGSYSDYLSSTNALFAASDAFGVSKEYDKFNEILPAYYEENYETYEATTPKYKYELVKEGGIISVNSFEIIDPSE